MFSDLGVDNTLYYDSKLIFSAVEVPSVAAAHCCRRGAAGAVSARLCDLLVYEWVRHLPKRTLPLPSQRRYQCVFVCSFDLSILTLLIEILVYTVAANTALRTWRVLKAQ